jgi:ubiquinone/menaquinone biosynthesis C-methylase UbiE
MSEPARPTPPAPSGGPPSSAAPAAAAEAADQQRDPTGRFSDRVENYIAYRPGYPDALVDALRNDVGLSARSTVADIGSGTGISSELLLRIGCEVYAVEPNSAMRRAAETRFSGETRFHSVDARAESTMLPDASVDAVTAGQAFHWFDRDLTRREFARILRPAGRVALFWNTRRVDGTPFLRAYERLLMEFGTDYAQVDHRRVDAESLRSFFRGPWESRVFLQEQVFDFAGIRGRLLSSSYVPGSEHPRHGPMLQALREIFDAHQQDGRVRLEYDTELFFGPLPTAID